MIMYAKLGDPDYIYQLNHTFFVYKDGNTKKAVPLITDYALCFHDKYYDKDTDKTYDITYSSSPNSGCNIIYFGLYELDQDRSKFGELFLRDNNISFNQLSGEIVSGSLHENLRRHNIKMYSLRELLGKYPDCLFIKVDDKNKKMIKLIKGKLEMSKNIEYDYHTLVYGLIYRSKKGYFKYSVLVHKNTNLDISKSKYTYYLKTMKKKIKMKSGYLIPCFFGAWIIKYPDSRIVRFDK